MSPESQRIAIAEAEGYSWSVPHYTHAKRWEVTLCRGGGHWTKEDSEWAGHPPIFEGCYHNLREVPDYLSDLNAMHEAENRLLSSSKLKASYSNCLSDLTNDQEDGFLVYPERSPSPRRLEALLRTIGKWKEGEG